jgi:hypothetical protein
MQERIIAHRKALIQGGPAGRLLGKLSPFLLVAGVAFLAACGGPKVGSVPHVDARTSIELAPKEAEHLRAGMRIYLASIQGIVEALARNKMEVVASESKRAGMGMLSDIPVSLVMELPPAFVALSMDTHQKFDALSREAQSSGTKSSVLTHLQEILANCTTCHATYRVSRKR